MHLQGFDLLISEQLKNSENQRWLKAAVFLSKDGNENQKSKIRSPVAIFVVESEPKSYARYWSVTL